jgi:hypothetical protein
VKNLSKIATSVHFREFGSLGLFDLGQIASQRGYQIVKEYRGHKAAYAAF